MTGEDRTTPRLVIRRQEFDRLRAIEDAARWLVNCWAGATSIESGSALAEDIDAGPIALDHRVSATLSATPLCPDCAHPLTEHQTPGGECCAGCAGWIELEYLRREPCPGVRAALACTPTPSLDGLRRAVDRLNGIGADLHWRSVDDARRWSDGVNHFTREADEYLAALSTTPAPLDAIDVLRALWNAEIDDKFRVSDNFDENDPLTLDVERLIAREYAKS